MKQNKKTNTALTSVGAAPELQSEQQLASDLQKQYTATLAAHDHAVREAIKFGMMMVAAGTVLTRENTSTKLHDPRGGTGLKAWLCEHCPDIDYKTAMRWKSIAEQVNEHAELPQEADWTELLQAPQNDPAIVAVNKALDSVIDGRSLRQLTFDFAPETPTAAKAREELYAAEAAAPDDPSLKQCVERVEAGTLPVNRWKPAYVGLKETKHQKRPPTNYGDLAKRSLISLYNALVTHAADISDGDTDGNLDLLADALRDLPDVTRQKLIKKLPEGIFTAAPKKRRTGGAE